MNRFLMVRMSLAVVVLAAPCAAARASAATITVNSTSLAVVQGDGQCTLIEAMENARSANGDYIDCAAGEPESNVIELQAGQTYMLPGAWTNPGTVAALALPIVTRALTINGHGSTLRPGTNAGAFRVLFVNGYPGSLTLNDLTIRDVVLPDGADGAVYNDSGALTINRSTFRGMRVEAGGSGGGAVTSRACRASFPPPCGLTGEATLIVADSVFEDNESRSTTGDFGAGAGVSTYALGDLTNNFASIRRSRFHGNTATNRGGALSNAAHDSRAISTLSIVNSSITANTATGAMKPALGGGLANFLGAADTGSAAGARADLLIFNSTIAGNTAANGAAGDGYGGGISNEMSCGVLVSCDAGSVADVWLRYVTMYGNVAGRDPAGSERGAAVWSNSNDPTLRASISADATLLSGNLANGTTANCRFLNTAVGSAGHSIANDSSCGDFFDVFTEAQINLAPLNVTGFTYYLAPQAGSVAIDRIDCSDQDQIGTPRPIGPACDVGAIESTTPSRRRAISDFDGDGRSDVGIFRPGIVPGALWYSLPTQRPGAVFQIYFGAPGDIPVPADYDGDGKTDAVIWRPSTGLWVGPRTGSPTLVTQFLMGQNGDIPVPCDYDGDGADDPAIYRPGTGQWFGTRADGTTVVLNTNLGFMPGDIPVPADFNGDGRCDPAIMRPGVGPGGTNLWYSAPSGGGAAFQIYFGVPGDIPVPADYDGDGKADAVIFRPSTGLWIGPRTGGTGLVTQVVLGQPGDIPVPGDYNADGATDLAIYEPTNFGLFFVVDRQNRFVMAEGWGSSAGDIPTAARPNYPSDPPSMTTSVQRHSAVPSKERPADVSEPSTRAGHDMLLRKLDESGAPLPESSSGLEERSPAIRPGAESPQHGTRRALTFTVSDPRGATNIRTIYTSIYSSSGSEGSCLIAYDAALSTLRLADDTTTQWSPALAVGAPGSVTNSQCAVQSAGSSVSADATTLALAISVTFEPAFAGDTTAYGLALDAEGGSSGWQWLGRWRDPSARGPLDSLATLPAGGALAQTFTHTVSTSGGASDLGAIYLMVNSSLNVAESCLVAYDPATNTLQLADDTGTGWSSPVTVGGQGPIANSQCAVEPAGSAVSAGAGTFTVSIPITFHARFAGPKNVYGLAVDGGGVSSHWQLLGIWTVPDVAPAVWRK